MTEDIVYSENDLKQLFEAFDLDRDGHISREEFFALFSHIDADADELEKDLAFTIIDKDGSGLVGFAEFAEWWLAR